MNAAMLVLAAPDPAGRFNQFLNSGLGGLVQNIAALVGVVIVFVAIFTIAKGAMSGRMQQVWRTALGAVVVCALLFNLSWFGTIVGWAVQIVSALIETITSFL